jgi:hypothetical protein
MKDMRRVVAKAALALGGMLVGLLLVEAGCWCYLALSPPARHVGRWEFRCNRPAPYHDADYFGTDFLSESMRSVRLETRPGAGFVVPGDFTGRFINVRASRRHTTDQPAAFTHRVLLFGGSTVFCHQVPDSWTVASCLQRLLNRQAGPRFRVENYGTSAMIAAQQTERLRLCDIRPGDVVVFYDGVNDVYYPIYNGNPDGWRPGDGHDGGPRRLSAVQRRLYPWCLRYRDHSATARFLFHAQDNPPPRSVSGARSLDRHLGQAETGYRNALIEAKRLAARHGARFYHFLQPSIFSLRQPTAFEAQVKANDLLALPGLDRAFGLGYPRLRAATTGVVSFDLSAILDQRDADEEFYLDFCHVNHTANQRIALAIFQHIFAWVDHTEPPAP